MKEKYGVEYAKKINTAIGELLNEGDSINNEDEFLEFIYAFSCLAPTVLFNQMTGENKNTLEFNHFANEMIFSRHIDKELK